MKQSAPVAMDRWLVFPPALHKSLGSEWRELAASPLMDLRLDQAVEPCASLQALAQRARELLNAKQPTLRVVLQSIDEAAIAALDAMQPPLLPGEVQAIHLYDFAEQALDVLATLCTPESRIQALARDSVPPGVTLAAQEVDELFQQRHREAYRHWWMTIDVAQAGAAEPLVDEPGIHFDWARPVVLEPDRTTNIFHLHGAVEVWAVDETLPIPPEPGRMRLRWTLQHDDLPRDAIEVVMSFARAPTTLDTSSILRIRVAEALGPLPDHLALSLTGGVDVASLQMVPWQSDPSRATRAQNTANLPLNKSLRNRIESLGLAAMTLRTSATGSDTAPGDGP